MQSEELLKQETTHTLATTECRSERDLQDRLLLVQAKNDHKDKERMEDLNCEPNDNLYFIPSRYNNN